MDFPVYAARRMRSSAFILQAEREKRRVRLDELPERACSGWRDPRRKRRSPLRILREVGDEPDWWVSPNFHCALDKWLSSGPRPPVAPRRGDVCRARRVNGCWWADSMAPHDNGAPHVVWLARGPTMLAQYLCWQGCARVGPRRSQAGVEGILGRTNSGPIA
jgi:hypothetical protein